MNEEGGGWKRKGHDKMAACQEWPHNGPTLTCVAQCAVESVLQMQLRSSGLHRFLSGQRFVNSALMNKCKLTYQLDCYMFVVV